MTNRLAHLFPYSRKETDQPKLKIAVKISGGIGDAIIIARWLRDYLASLKCECSVDLYFKSYRATEFIFSSIPGMRAFYDDALFDAFRTFYDVSFYINQFVDNWIGMKKLPLLAFEPQILNVVAKVWQNRQKWKKFAETHPNFDGAFADLAVLKGRSRETFIHYFTGISYGGPRLPITSDDSILTFYPELTQPYFTVHDGWDGGFTGLAARPTKALLKKDWPILVDKIKKLTPYKVIQIGGAVGSSISGVDLDLKGKISLQRSTAILKRSALHLDTESGLVHIGSALGVRSVVLFGPTNLNFFGYKENINIPPNLCGNCWWSEETWMQKCPAKHEVPICMESHDLDRIANLVVEALGRQAALA